VHDRRCRRVQAYAVFLVRCAIEFSVIAAAAVALAVAASSVAGKGVATSTGAWYQGEPELPPSVTLAKAFTAALNAHDTDTLVSLFTDEDAGPTVSADRSAWLKFEIRVWAEQQFRSGIRVEAHEYWLTEQGAAWNADVCRDDWHDLGVRRLPVTNSIWVHNGKVANFTSRPRQPIDVAQLGGLWQPGASSSGSAS
jgi:hypothetical protein